MSIFISLIGDTENRVLVRVFESTTTSVSFNALIGSFQYTSNNYNKRGHADDFALVPSYKDYSAMRMETYFVAPYTG